MSITQRGPQKVNWETARECLAEIHCRAASLRSLLACFIFFSCVAAHAQSVDPTQKPDPRALAIFQDHIAPLLSQKCFKCHSHETGKAKGGLVLDSRSGWSKGGEHGPALHPGKPGESLLLKAISYEDPDLQMPPPKEGGKLTSTEIEYFREWIRLGAPDPRAETVVTNDVARLEQGRNHWAFQSVKRSPVPNNTSRPVRIHGPIDAFVVAKLGAVRQNPEANRRTLIRRVYFDLIGLPPSPAEVESFISSANPRAYEQLVDRLLESPHYGERWGRHWLDVAGFSESSLFIGDVMRPGFWRYRDYVIRAFNSDKPYDRFLIEQLAGDELFDWRNTDNFSLAQIDLLAATGFLRCPPDATDNQPITQMEKRFATQQNAVEVAVKALSGLSMNCVRCHSHKYDPIEHDEYYRLIALFQPAYDPEDWLAGIWGPVNSGPVRAIPILNRQAREAYERRALAWPEEKKQLNREVNGGLQRAWRDRHLKAQLERASLDPTNQVFLAILAKEPSGRSVNEEKSISTEAERLGITREFLESNDPEFTNALHQAKVRQEAVRKETAELPPVIWAAYDVSTKPSPTRLLSRGDFERPAQPIEPGILRVLDDPHAPFTLPKTGPFAATTGRRLALARWLTRSSHPLTARVIVNRVWQYHFGTGLVTTPDDFGARGARPTHPELLDWLAAEFMERGWSIKHLHRLILHSATYKQTSEDRADAHSSDPGNKWLWKFPRRRLEAELVRDTMLELGHQLDHTLFGESVLSQRLPDGQFVIATNKPGKLRRTVYLSTKRTGVLSFLTAFDAPIMDANWPRRMDSVIPQQALALMNNPFVVDCAHRFAVRVLRESSLKFEKRLEHAFILAYGRSPEPGETSLFSEFHRQKTSGPDPANDLKVFQLICQALLSSNEFLYVD